MGTVMAADIVVSRELKLVVARRALSGSAGAAPAAPPAIPPSPAEPPKEGADERCHPAVKRDFWALCRDQTNSEPKETIMMTSEDLAALRRKLDDLSRRLDARTREFAQTGEFSDVHEALISQIRQRHDELRTKVDAAAREGTSWDLVRAEFTRDHSSIFDDLLQLEERLDVDAVKKRDLTEK